MLPALSSISTRREMHPLMHGLAGKTRVMAPDWPGFGNQPKPPVAWTPEALSNFLAKLVCADLPKLRATVAAGHAATYALHLAAQQPGLLGHLVLLAPTWRGPLPAMAGGDRPVFASIRRAVGMPILGPLLYRLNVNPLVVRMMVAGHVYSDSKMLPESWRRSKQAVIQAPGARFGSAAFVTGRLDRTRGQDEFPDLARRASGPFLVAYGLETPPKSRAEMVVLSTLPEAQSWVAPRGKLGFYEEFADDLLPALTKFVFCDSLVDADCLL